MAVVPLRFANTRGIPMIEVQSVVSDTSTYTLMFNDHPQRRGNFFGGFFVKLPTIATGTKTVSFGTLGLLGSEIPLYMFDGKRAIMSDIAGSGGVALCFYDKTTNRLQILGVPKGLATTD